MRRVGEAGWQLLKVNELVILRPARVARAHARQLLSRRAVGLNHGNSSALSPERSFDAAEGEVTDFSCHGATIWPICVALLAKPDVGITLKQE